MSEQSIEQTIQKVSLTHLPLEILLKIYQYLSPEEAEFLVLINKYHRESISNPFWQFKFEIHFGYLLKDLPEKKDINWYQNFHKAYDEEYRKLSICESRWFSSVKEGKPFETEVCQIEPTSLLITDDKGNTLISWARRNHHLHILSYFWHSIIVPFFASGAQVSRGDIPEDMDHMTQLHWAALLGQIEPMQNLLANSDYSINARAWSYYTDNDYTALHYAVQEGHVEMVKLLLNQRADINAIGADGTTPLLLAIEYIQNNDPSIVDILLNHHADTSISITDEINAHLILKEVSEGETPLHIAVRLGRTDIVKKLLDAKANIEATTLYYNQTALHYAAKEGNAEMVELLIERGANIDVKDGWGMSFFHIAAESGYEDMVEKLLDAKKVSIDAPDADLGWTALHHATEQGHVNMVKLLLEHGANINARDSDGATPLLLAVKNDKLEVVKLLLEHNAVVPLDKTPLHYAAQKGHAEMVELLLKHGANINAPETGDKTPLHYAAQKGHVNMVKLLLEHGANINARDSDGATPLLLASAYNQPECVAVLLEHDADTSTPDLSGNIPLHTAARNGYVDIVKELMRGENFARDIEILNSEHKKPLDVAQSNVKPLIALSYYSIKRAKLEGDFKIFSLLGIPIFERSFTFFGHQFGYTKKQKLDAADALKTAVLTGDSKAYQDILKPHKGALENGELGDIYNQLCKRGLLK